MKLLKNTKLLFFMNLCINMSLFAPVEVIYLRSIGLSIAQISIANLLVPVVSAVFDVPTGMLGDYFGRKKVLMLSCASFSLSMALLLFTSNIPMVYMVYFFEGFGWSLYSSNTDAIIVEDSIHKKANVSKQLAIYYSGLSLGSVLSGMANSIFSISSGKMNFKFFILITVLMRLTSMVFVMLVEVGNDGGKSCGRRLNKLRPTGILIRNLNVIRHDSFSISEVFYEATGRLIYYLPVIIQPLFLKSGMSITYFGIIYSVSQAVQFVIQGKCDVIVNKLGKNFILKFSPVANAVGLALLVFNNVGCLIAGFIVIQAVNPIRGQCLTLQKNKMVGNEIRATYLSSLSFMVLVINSVFLSIVGFIMEKHLNLSIGIMVSVILIAGLFTYRNITDISKEVCQQKSKQSD